MNKDAKDFPSLWTKSPPLDLFDTPTLVFLPEYKTLLPLSHFFHEWECLPGVSSWALRTVRSGYTLQFGRNPPLLRQGSPDSSKQRLKGFCATAGAAAGTVLPPQRGKRGSPSIRPGKRLFQPLFPCAKEGRRFTTLSIYKRKFKMMTLKTIMSQIRVGDWFVTFDLKDTYFHIQVVWQHRKLLSVCLWREGLSIQSSCLWSGFGAEDVHKMHGCCPGPVEAPGHSCTQLPGLFAHSGPLQGVSELSQRCCPPPRSCSWPQNKHQEECSLPLSANCVFGSSLGFRSDADPSGSCPDFQPQYMFGPLQVRPSCFRENLSQAFRPHGRSLPCAP